MKNQTRFFALNLSLILLFVTVIGSAPGIAGVTVDNSIYAELLSKYVHNGAVDYDALKKEEPRLEQYLKQLEGVDPQELSREEQFALYINAYNAWTIKLILGGYPGLDSIKDLGSIFKSPWKKKIVRINGEILTLDNIEHDILRPRFKDPRVHFAINCAAYSCPPLRSEPFQGSRLDEQLDDSTREFVNNPGRTYFKDNTLYVSKIFKWFSEDFNDDPYTFVSRYATGPLKKDIETSGSKGNIKYLHYDWSLNNKPQ